MKLLVLFCCWCCFLILLLLLYHLFFIIVTITIIKFLPSHFVYSHYSSLLQAINHANRNLKLLRLKKRNFSSTKMLQLKERKRRWKREVRQIKTERHSAKPSSSNQTMKTKTHKIQLFPLTNYFRRRSNIGLLSN